MVQRERNHGAPGGRWALGEESRRARRGHLPACPPVPSAAVHARVKAASATCENGLRPAKKLVGTTAFEPAPPCPQQCGNSPRRSVPDCSQSSGLRTPPYDAMETRHRSPAPKDTRTTRVRRSAHPRQSGRPGAHRGPGPDTGAARDAALAQQPLDGGGLARRAQGRRRGRHDHGRPACPGARPARRADPPLDRARGPPVRRGRIRRPWATPSASTASPTTPRAPPSYPGHPPPSDGSGQPREQPASCATRSTSVSRGKLGRRLRGSRRRFGRSGGSGGRRTELQCWGMGSASSGPCSWSQVSSRP